MMKMKKIVAVILLLTLALSLTACSGNSEQSNAPTTTTKPVETQPQTAIDKLNEKELFIFKAVKGYLVNFKSPTTARVVEVLYGEGPYDENLYYLQISAQNSFGGNVVDDYTIAGDGELDTQSYYTESYADAVPDVSIGKINDALSEYCDSMGW